MMEWLISREQKMILLGLILGLSVLAYATIIRPTLFKYRHLKETTLSLRLSFEDKHKQWMQKTLEKHRQIALKKEFFNIMHQCRSERDVPNVLEAINQAAKETDLRLSLSLAKPQKEHDFYRRHTVRINLKGNYRALSLFVRKVTDKIQLILFTSFLIEKNVSKKYDRAFALNMTITADIYCMRMKA